MDSAEDALESVTSSATASSGHGTGTPQSPLAPMMALVNDFGDVRDARQGGLETVGAAKALIDRLRWPTGAPAPANKDNDESDDDESDDESDDSESDGGEGEGEGGRRGPGCAASSRPSRSSSPMMAEVV
eukprot:m.61552 g.61552  ORF g.61552 m.61552 type:complete len:130 (-) comp13227_c1_seq2:25-414(-)